jgi:phage recombination protein Bet
MNEVVEAVTTQVAVSDRAAKDNEIKAYLTKAMSSFGVGNHLSEEDRFQFVNVCKLFGLNPFKREIYAVPHKDKRTNKVALTIMVGYEVYIKRAERTGKLNGWSVKTEGSIKPGTITKFGRKVDVYRGDMKAIVSINRKGFENPFVWEVDFEEYTQDNSMWFNKPRTMLKKVAIAQAFRLCFSEETDGMPYTSDELPDDMKTYPVIHEKENSPSVPAIPKSVPDTKEDGQAIEPEPQGEVIAEEESQQQEQESETPIAHDEEVFIGLAKKLGEAIWPSRNETNLLKKAKEFGERENIKIMTNPFLKVVVDLGRSFINDPSKLEAEIKVDKTKLLITKGKKSLEIEKLPF